MLKKSLFGVMTALSAMTFMVPGGANAADMKMTATAIGRPPIFSNTFADVGEAMGFWKKAGLDVTFRWFQRGTDTAKAVVTGDAAIGFTATPPAANLIASGAKIKIVAGMPNQDWVIASDEAKDCKGLKGKTVAADGINNTRYLYLQSYLATCGLKISDVKAINLANTPLVKAGIARPGACGVFHIDELAQVEHATKKWNIMDVPASIAEGLHYAVLVANDKAIKNDREGLVRFLVGWIETQKMMGSKDPKTMEKVAEIAAKAKKDRQVGGAERDQGVPGQGLLGRQQRPQREAGDEPGQRAGEGRLDEGQAPDLRSARRHLALRGSGQARRKDGYDEEVRRR